MSYGFARGGVLEGGLMALTGGLAGYAILLVFRVLRGLTRRSKGE